jgi:hypothetical protein
LERCATVASTCWPHSAGGVKVLTPWGIELGLSSIEPNDAGDELAGCQGFARGLLIARAIGRNRLSFGGEVLDPMARAIELSVIVAQRRPVGSQQDRRRFANRSHRLDDTVIGVELPVHDRRIVRHRRQEVVRSRQVVCRSSPLSGRSRPGYPARRPVYRFWGSVRRANA